MGASPQTPTALGRTRPTLPLVPRPAARREPREGLQCKSVARALRARQKPLSQKPESKAYSGDPPSHLSIPPTSLPTSPDHIAHIQRRHSY